MATSEIPAQSLAAIYDEATKSISVRPRATPKPKDTEVLVKVSCSGVCGSDMHLTRRAIASLVPKPGIAIFGHEGVGMIAALGPDVDGSAWRAGDRVGVRWLHSVCKTCEWCTTGFQSLCVARRITSVDVDGAFAQYAIADSTYLVRIPDGVSDEHAAPILCAGVTVYKALKVAQLRPGSWVAIAGAGGGLGHLAIQYAKAMGYKALALDAKKRDICLKLGADVYVDFLESKDAVQEVIEATNGGAHGVLVTASSTKAYHDAPKYTRRAGTMICVGVSETPTQIPSTPEDFVIRGIKFMGSSTGNIQDTDEALEFLAKGKIKPIIAEKNYRDLDQVMDDMYNLRLEGRVVVKVD